MSIWSGDTIAAICVNELIAVDVVWLKGNGSVYTSRLLMAYSSSCKKKSSRSMRGPLRSSRGDASFKPSRWALLMRKSGSGSLRS